MQIGHAVRYGGLTAAEAGCQVGPDSGQAVQGLHDVIQGRGPVAVQLALGLQELVHCLPPQVMPFSTAITIVALSSVIFQILIDTHIQRSDLNQQENKLTQAADYCLVD